MNDDGRWNVDTLHEHFDTRMAANVATRMHEFELLRESLKSQNEHQLYLLGEMDKRYQAGFSAARDAVLTTFDSQKALVSAQLDAANRAVQKAELAYEKRFDAVNEFRATLSDQQRTLMPRSEAENRLSAMGDRLDELQKRYERSEGRSAGGANMWGYIVAGVSVLILLITFLGGIWSKVQ